MEKQELLAKLHNLINKGKYIRALNLLGLEVYGLEKVELIPHSRNEGEYKERALAEVKNFAREGTEGGGKVEVKGLVKW